MTHPLQSPDFPARVVAARVALARDDPDGEREAIAPLPSVYELVARGQWEPGFHGLRAEWVDEIDIPDEPPPMALPPIVLDEGPAVLFGMGEARKSILSQVIATSVATGREVVPGWRPNLSGRVLWLDYENGRRRCARRQRLLGPAPILYVSCARPSWDDADALAAVATDLDARLVIVDSIVAATGAMSPKDPETAGRYFGALGRIGPRSLSIAHITKDAPDATMPFGSVYFHNFARVTWRSRVDDQGRVTLTNHKHTDGDRLPSTTLAFDFDEERLTVRHATPQLTTDVLAELVTDRMTTAQVMTAVRDAGYQVGRSWLADLLKSAVSRCEARAPRARFLRTARPDFDRTKADRRPVVSVDEVADLDVVRRAWRTGRSTGLGPDFERSGSLSGGGGYVIPPSPDFASSGSEVGPPFRKTFP